MKLTVNVGFEELLTLVQQLPPEQKSQLKTVLEDSEAESSKTPPGRPLGSMKGLVVYMADDFDEPLDDFKEYM